MQLTSLIKSPRGLRAATALFAAASVLCVGLAAAAWPRPDLGPDVRRLMGETHGDLSDRSLAAIAAKMDAGGLAIARRHDPAIRQRPIDVLPGWENYSLTGRPNLGFDATTPEEAERINAALPAFAGDVAAARPFFGPRDAIARARAVHCLADAVYYEAALEPREGQEAVAQVVLNRVRDPDFPSSVCGVVFQGADQSTGCQFSFTCDGSMARPPEAIYWKQAEDVAKRALDGYVAASVGTATHYHADYVLPYWSPTLIKLGKFGKQIFYRWRGAAGEAAAFVQRYAGREPFIDEAKYRKPRPAPQPTLADPQAKLIQASVTTAPAKDSDGRDELVIGGSMAGHRRPSGDDVARINAALAKFEQGLGGSGGKSAMETSAVTTAAPLVSPASPGPGSN